MALHPWSIHLANDLLRLHVQLPERHTVDAGDLDPSVHVLELLAQIDAPNGDVGTSFPWSRLRVERVNLRIGTRLLIVQPVLLLLTFHLARNATMILYLTRIRRRTPTTLILVI